MSRTDLVDMIAHCGAHGDHVSVYFCDQVEPQLAALSNGELFNWRACCCISTARPKRVTLPRMVWNHYRASNDQQQADE